MTRLHERIADLLVAEITGRDAWDEPPALYFAYLEGGEPRLSDLDIEREIWAQGRTADVLAGMADAMEAGAQWIRPAVPEGLFGIGIRTEAYQVRTAPDATAEEIARDRADAEAHRIRHRPDAVETRFMHVVDRAGITYVAALRRDTGELIQRDIVYPKPGTSAATGFIIESLDRMLMVMLGITPPDRTEPAWWGGGGLP